MGECPEGNLCVENKISNVPIGSYISLTPTSTSYTISKDLTGYSEDQTINPSELNLWRVIRRSDEYGTIDIISEYVSSTDVIFFGETGYKNFVGVLNEIAAQYTDEVHIVKTRHVGYSSLTIEKCTGALSEKTCPADAGFIDDLSIVNSVLGLAGKKLNGGESGYFFASRGENLLNVRVVYWGCSTAWGNKVCSYRSGSGYLGERSGEGLYITYDSRVRPVLTLKADIKIKSGDGKSAETAYTLE